MCNWEEDKKEIKRLALAIKGSTKEESPADLANLEDYIYKTYYKEKNQPMQIDEDYYCYNVNLDCDDPFATLCHKDDCAIEETIKIPHQLAYYLTTHWCGSQKMHDLIEKNAIRSIQSKLKEILGV
jgi:hypothetical protein